MNINDIVQQQIDAAEARRRAERDRRAAFKKPRQAGVQARHRGKLARIGSTEQHGATLALASLNRDHETVARLLDLQDTASVRQTAALALGALAELALNARPTSITRTRDALQRMQAAGPDQPPAA
ncbi:hypothetical protein [Streptomyces marokkonensis]|uniref:hypothetical protein n=1 Tax=Streptomyces marokkonensis TaxID=324855 RepID=UPI0011F31E08|nr:hypothetical protein [Streptomyces marokkonensis]